MDPGTSRVLAAIAIVSCVGLVGPAVAAAPPAAPPADPDQPALIDRIRAAVASLDDDRVDVRDSAMVWLASAGLGPDDLIEQLRRTDLSPEQRSRLMQLGPDSLGRRPRAALGVQFANAGFDEEHADDRGVMISATLEGFDSNDKLRAGDVLTRIGGERVLDFDDARAAIIAADPGDTLDLELIRGDRTVKVAVTLGDFTSLRDNARRLDGDFGAAWAVRVRRELGSAARPVIDAGLDAEAWFAVDASVAPGFRRPNYSGQVRRYGNTYITPTEFHVPDADGIVGAGEPRGGAAVSEARADLSRTESIRARSRPRVAGGPWPDNQLPAPIRPDARGAIERNIEQLKRMLEQAELGEAQRRSFEDRITLLQRELERLDDQAP